jgi:hypothetical protein
MEMNEGEIYIIIVGDFIDDLPDYGFRDDYDKSKGNRVVTETYELK